MSSWPATFLQSTAAATGSATINSVGSFGGFLGPTVTGFLQERFGGYAVAVCVLAVATFLDAILAACFPTAKVDVGSEQDEEGEFLAGQERSQDDVDALQEREADCIEPVQSI